MSREQHQLATQIAKASEYDPTTIGLVEQYLTALAQETNTPFAFRAPEIEFVLNAASTIIIDGPRIRENIPLQKIFLRAFQFLLDKKIGYGSQYKLKNNMQSMWDTFVRIADNIHNDTEMQSDWCFVLNKLIRCRHIHVDNNTRGLPKVLSALEQLTQFDKDIDPKKLYYDASYLHVNNIRTCGLILLETLSIRTKHQIYYELPVDCAWNRREPYVSAMKQYVGLTGQEKDRFMISLIRILADWSTNHDSTHPLLFCAALTSLSIIVGSTSTPDVTVESPYTQHYNYCYLAMESDDIRLKYVGLLCVVDFLTYTKNPDAAKLANRAYMLMKNYILDFIRDGHTDMLRAFIKLFVFPTFGRESVIKHRHIMAPIIITIAQKIDELAQDSQMMTLVYYFFDKNPSTMSNFTLTSVQPIVNYALNRYSDARVVLSKHVSNIFPVIIQLLLQANSITAQQLYSIKSIISTSFRYNNFNVSIAMALVGVFASNKALEMLSDEKPGKYITDVLLPMCINKLEIPEGDDPAYEFYVLAQVYKNYIAQDQELETKFRNEWLPVIVQQFSTYGSYTSFFNWFTRLCAAYPDEMLPVFRKHGWNFIVPIITSCRDMELVDEYYCTLNTMMDALGDHLFSFEQHAQIDANPTTTFQTMVLKKLRLLMKVNMVHSD